MSASGAVRLKVGTLLRLQRLAHEGDLKELDSVVERLLDVELASKFDATEAVLLDYMADARANGDAVSLRFYAGLYAHLLEHRF